MDLPSKKIKAMHSNPTNLVIASHMGTGKTTLVAALPNCLLVDFESGSLTMDAMRVDIQGEAGKQDKHPGVIFKNTIKAIKQLNAERGDYAYDFIAYDGITALEQLARVKATSDFKTGVVGKAMLEKGSVIRDVVTDVPKSGWLWFFNSFIELYNQCKGLSRYGVIFLAHTKQGSLLKGGSEVTSRDINLTGKAKIELLRDCTDCGYMYRQDENTAMISFKTGGNDVTIKSRSPHLANKEFEISKRNPETEEITINWHLIYPGVVDEPIVVSRLND